MPIDLRSLLKALDMVLLTLGGIQERGALLFFLSLFSFA